jgi:hypothetical protein
MSHMYKKCKTFQNNFQTGSEIQYMDCIQEVKITFSFQLQTSQMFKKELLILV